MWGARWVYAGVLYNSFHLLYQHIDSILSISIEVSIHEDSWGLEVFALSIYMSEYLSSIHSAILRKRGNVLSTLIALPFGTVPPSLYSVIDKIRTVDLSAFCGSKFDVHTSNYVKCGLLAMNSLVDRDFERGKIST